MKPITKFVIIVCDQWRRMMHWPKVRLPAFERLKSDGVELTQATIASAACSPSRACLFTGKYAQETGVTSTPGIEVLSFQDSRFLGKPPTAPAFVLPTSVNTLGSLLKQHGFSTHYKGKWNLSDAEGPWPKKPPTGLGAYGFSDWSPPEGHGREPERWGLRTDPVYTREAIDTLYALAREKAARFLVVVSLVNPHDIGFFYRWRDKVPSLRIPPPPNLEDPLDEKPPCQRSFRLHWADRLLQVRRALDRSRGRATVIGERWFAYQQLYGHLTQIADSHVGQILDALDETGLREETCVLFTSDHGEMGGSHGLVQKWYCAYEEILRVPLVFSHPSFGDARSTDALASSIDVVPTVLSLAGLPAPDGKHTLRGKDLSPILYERASSVQDEVLFATDDDIIGKGLFGFGLIKLSQPHHLRTLRTREHKLTRYFDPSGKEPELYELYDLTRDPGELDNLAARPMEGATRDLFEALRARLDALIAEKYDHPPIA